MTEVLFQDKDSTPWSNFINRLLIPSIIISTVIIGIPLFTNGFKFDGSMPFWIILWLCVILYHTTVAYIYSRQYLCKIESSSIGLELTVRTIKETNNVLVIKCDSMTKIRMKESLLSFNTRGISTWMVSFIQDDKIIFNQYQVGNWDTETFKKVLLQLKEKGFLVNASTSLVPSKR